MRRGITPRRIAARALAEKLGFRCEGLLRDNLRVGNTWRDEMLYALLTTDRLSQARLHTASLACREGTERKSRGVLTNAASWLRPG